MRRWLTGHAPEGEARLIHRDRNIAIAWLPGQSDSLVRVFTSISRKPFHSGRLEFRAAASGKGQNHVLFIADRRHCCRSCAGMRGKIADIVREFAAKRGIRTIRSIGGDGAILFCDKVPISRVVAFVPQILTTAAVIDLPHWASNRNAVQPTVERDLTPIMATKDTKFHIVYGDIDMNDSIHLGHLRRMLPSVGHFRIVLAPGQKYNVAKWLKSEGQPVRLVDAFWSGNQRELHHRSRLLTRPLDLSLA